jgi:hypothetical protein
MFDIDHTNRGGFIAMEFGLEILTLWGIPRPKRSATLSVSLTVPQR